MKRAVEGVPKILIDASGLAGCELSEESVFKLMGSHLTIKMMEEVCSVLDETKRILQYTRAPGADRGIAVRMISTSWPASGSHGNESMGD